MTANNYFNLTLSNAGTKAFGSGTTEIAGLLSISGATGDALTNLSTLEYNGTSATILGSFTPYYNLTLNDAAGVSGLTAITVNNTLEVKDGSFTNTNNSTYGNVIIDTNKTLIDGGFSVKGDWTNNGTFTANAKTVTFGGTGTQTIGLSSSNATTFATLTIHSSSNSNEINLAQDVTDSA